VFQADVIQQATKGFAPETKVHSVITSFAATVLEPLIERYSIYPAKGTSIPKFAHNADQMMVTHILNGLFPTLTLVYEAQSRELPRLANLQMEELKIFMLAYTMHDLDKILGDQLKTLTKKGTSESCQKLLTELARLNVHAFFPDVEHWIHEILWLAVNTQRSRDINLSHNTFVSSEALASDNEAIEILRTQPYNFRTRVESTLRDLCTFSDLLAFFVKSPEDALLSDEATRRGGIADLMEQLTDRQFSLAYHKLTEVRGLLSNQINNATIRYLQNIYPAEQEELIPYLYFPNGVVYLNPQRRAAPTIEYKAVHTSVEEEIREACRDRIAGESGLVFNPKGILSYPGYLHDFLTIEDFFALFVKKAKEGKSNIARDRLTTMKEMQAEGDIPTGIVLDYEPSEQITQLGIFLINYIRLLDKILSKLFPALKADLEKRLIERLGEDVWDEAQQIRSSGGVDYRFYWIAAQYLKTHPLATYEAENPGSSLEKLFNELVDELLQLAGDELRSSESFRGSYLRDLSDYLDKNLIFGFEATPHVKSLPNFAAELARYGAAKKSRLNQLTCTICNSAYPTQQQEDASVLFQPWVYKNRLPLYKSENAGGICSICSLELMLRQLLLRDKPGVQGRINVSGKSYEDLELKYFFLYPGFFFTNQTFHLSSYIIRRMKNLKLYEVCEILRVREKIGAADILNLSFFNLYQRDWKAEQRNEKDEKEEKGGMYLFDRYEEKQYPGFIFFAKRTFSKPKKPGDTAKTKATTASWVEAAWLGLALPLITGARVVVTESYLPLFNSCADFPETVVLDAPHQSVRHLLTSASARLRLDQLLGSSEGRQNDGDWIGGTLEAFSRAIELHIDTERAGNDLKLERFTRIARDLETDQLFVFSFLKEQMRQAKLEVIPAEKAYHYSHIYSQFVKYFHSYEGDVMDKTATRHERVVELYSAFYSPFIPGKPFPKTHAIVRPVDIAAERIINDTQNLNDDEIRLEMVAEIVAWLERINREEPTTRRAFLHSDKTVNEKEERLVAEFVDYFYKEIFKGYAEGERSVLNSRLNRFKNGCEVAFRRRHYKDKGQSTSSSPSEQAVSGGET